MSPLLVFVVIFLVTVIVYKKLTDKSTANYPPGPIRLPIIGSYLQLLWMDYKRPHISMMKLKEHYNSPLISWGMGGFNVVVANDYETCKEIFNNPDLQGRVPAYPALLRSYGSPNGYLGDDGPRWLHMKRQSLRALRDLGFGRRSEGFELVIQDELQSLVDHISDLKGSPTIAPDVFYPPYYNLINHFLYEYRWPEKDREVLVNIGRVARRMLLSFDATGRLITLWPWMRHIFPKTLGYTDLLASFTDFDAYISKFYNTHKNDNDPEVRRDIVDFFLEMQKENPKWFTDEETLSCCMDLMMPNTGVAILTSFTLGLLAQHPEELNKCLKELDEVVGRGRLPTIDDRPSLRMIDCAMRETMRLLPITPLGVPHRSTSKTTLSGYDVPAESLIITNLWAMNHDQKLWGDPEVFRPERFLDKKDYTFSFGLGKRVCAGETFARNNYFLVVATVLQNFVFEMSTPMDPERYEYGAAMAPNPDLAFKFTPRK